MRLPSRATGGWATDLGYAISAPESEAAVGMGAWPILSLGHQAGACGVDDENAHAPYGIGAQR